MTTQNRLKSERERLGFSQSAFAELAKVGKTTVINWEKGASAPDAIQLGFLSAAGLDVLYVINGLRSQGLPVQNTLPPDQQVLLSSYERCQPEAKQHLIQTAALLSAGMSAAPISAGQHNSGEGAVLVNGSVTGGVNRGRVTRRRNAGDA